MNARPAAPVLGQAVRRLRAMALAAADGAFLGSEEEMRALLDVSRPTLRQAARILEQERLIEMRMGKRGGIYAARPDLQTVARSAAQYLQIEGTTLLHLLNVYHGLREQVTTAACGCTDDAMRERLAAFLAGVSASLPAENTSLFLEHERRFEQLLVDMAGNPALGLFTRIARRFVDENPASQVFIARPEVRRSRCQAWLSLGSAVLAGDRARAIALGSEQQRAFVAMIPGESLHDMGIGGSDLPASAAAAR